MEPVNKRKRSGNWDASGKILLQQLIEEKINIIEDKNVDTNTSKAKREAWNDILNSFNKCSNNKRDVAQIQNQWRNTKMKAKQRVSTYRREREATGGGPPPEPPSPSDEHLMSLIPNEFATDKNTFDCDRTFPQEDVNKKYDIEYVENEIEFLLEGLEDNDTSCVPPQDDNEPEGDLKESSYKSKTDKKSTTKAKSKIKKTQNSTSDENLKLRYLEVAIDAKNTEVQQLKEKFSEEMENLRLERERKDEEHFLKIQAFEADERRKFELEQVGAEWQRVMSETLRNFI